MDNPMLLPEEAARSPPYAGQPHLGQPYPGQAYQQPMQTPMFNQQGFNPMIGVPFLGQNPTPVQCPKCQQQVITVVQNEVGTGTWLIALAICFFGGVMGCCLIPFCLPMCKDSIHTCPSCGNLIGRRNLI